jgi:predicted nucleotidyltransferase component of viral defense system
MLTQVQVRRFAHESGIKDLQVVEKEILLTYLLQLLAETGFLREVAFKGGTCIRKTWFGAKGRFSTDLDFTSVVAGKTADDAVMQLADLMSAPFHDIQFGLDLGDKGWYEAGDGVSWGSEPHYRHAWGEGTIKLQVSNREVPTLPPDDRSQLEVSYFGLLPFRPSAIPCLRIEEILAEKIRATYQRAKPRDIWDLDQFANRPVPETLIRKLVVTKLWQVSDAFSPDKWFKKLEQATKWDWDDLRQLVRGGAPDPKLMLERCAKRFAFLKQLDADEEVLATDPHQRRADIHKRSVKECHRLAQERRLT